MCSAVRSYQGLDCQAVRCVFDILAIFHKSFRTIANIVDCLADATWHCVIGCMVAQTNRELEFRATNPIMTHNVQVATPIAGAVPVASAVPIATAPMSTRDVVLNSAGVPIQVAAVAAGSQAKVPIQGAGVSDMER